MFNRLLFVFAFLFLLAPMPVLAEVTEPGEAEPVAKASWYAEFPGGKNEHKSLPHTSVTITPHRAVYTMSLASAKNGSSINGVTGRMLFEWGDSCDGWPVQQILQLHFSYAEGDESVVNSSVISWESKDGKRYNFNVRRVSNGKEAEDFRGRATMGEQGGSVIYAIPHDKKEIVLTEDTLFPSAHTRMILEKAGEGDEQFFTRRVFDGSDEEGQADVSAFIGEKDAKVLGSEVNAALRDNPLLVSSYWPVRLAFFDPQSETGESDYEMNVVLQANGIARSMLIDYGDFAVSGVLSRLEALPAARCGGD